MGTTILAVWYNGIVVTGANTRTSSSGYVMNWYAPKLTFVLDNKADKFATSVRSWSGRPPPPLRSCGAAAVAVMVISQQWGAGGDNVQQQRWRGGGGGGG